MIQKHRALFLGGANSGKSKQAESFANTLSKTKIYVATALCQDNEMRAKIDAHQKRRGADWRTLEISYDLPPILHKADSESVLLIECITMLLSNMMLESRDINAQWERLSTAIFECPAHLVFVSNEVGHSIVPDNKMAREFVALQGEWNQKLAQLCNHVTFVAAGLPLVLKGA